MAAYRGVSKDGELVCSTAFLFSPCAPHTASTPGRLPERAEPIRMSPEPVGLTWITDWARPLQQADRLKQVHARTRARTYARPTWREYGTGHMDGAIKLCVTAASLIHDRKFVFFPSICFIFLY